MAPELLIVVDTEEEFDWSQPFARDSTSTRSIPAQAKAHAEMERQYLEKVSLRRMVTAQDVAAMVLFLVSPLGRNVSGQSLGVCGNVETL